MPTPKIGLSKSRITLFEQCPKRLWLTAHHPDLAEVDDGTRAAFADGHRVGDLACSLYPDGIMISAEAGLGKAVEETAALLSGGWDKPIFEATFAHEGVLVRVDILLPSGAGWGRTVMHPSHARSKAIADADCRQRQIGQSPFCQTQRASIWPDSGWCKAWLI